MGADGWFMADLIGSNPFPCYYRSILTVWIHSLMYRCLFPLGIDAWNAISISSSLAGAIAIVGLWRLKPNVWFLVINIMSGSFLVFVGHVENYAWVNTFLIWSFLEIQRWLDNGERLWPATVCLMLACLSHMLAIFYVPAFVYVLWKNRRYPPMEILIPVLCLTGLISILSLTVQLLGTDNGLNRLVPLFHTWAKNHHFTFLSLAHFEILFHFHHRTAFLLIPLELPLLYYLRKEIDTLFLRFLFACVICGLVWTTIWHPDWGRRDWDLFGQFGIPLHVLLGLLVVKKWNLSTVRESS